MKVFTSSEGYLLRLLRGEEIHASLCAFAEERGLRGATISGIGAVHDAEVGYFNRSRREYDRREEPGFTELLSLTGNLCLLQGAPFLHAHAVLMRSDFTLAGGHLFRATVAVTAEIAVRATDLDLVRLPDEEIGISLLEDGSG